jgi:hypothetical protein
MALKNSDQSTPTPHIGNLINDFIQNERKSPSALSRKLNMTVANLLNIRKKETVQLKLLWDISQVYQHNFIADVAVLLPGHFTGALQDVLAEKDKEIAAVKLELETVIKERELLKELFRR